MLVRKLFETEAKFYRRVAKSVTCPNHKKPRFKLCFDYDREDFVCSIEVCKPCCKEFAVKVTEAIREAAPLDIVVSCIDDGKI